MVFSDLLKWWTRLNPRLEEIQAELPREGAGKEEIGDIITHNHRNISQAKMVILLTPRQSAEAALKGG